MLEGEAGSGGRGEAGSGGGGCGKTAVVSQLLTRYGVTERRKQIGESPTLFAGGTVRLTFLERSGTQCCAVLLIVLMTLIVTTEVIANVKSDFIRNRTAVLCEGRGTHYL